jgi:hypothetical protein
VLVVRAAAVLVDAVLDQLGGGGTDPGAAVVAVRAVGDIAPGQLAGGEQALWIPEAVPVQVQMAVLSGRGVPVVVCIVDEPVAVVVAAVAGLGGARVDPGQVVPAVPALHGGAFGLHAGLGRGVAVSVAVPVAVHVEGGGRSRVQIVVVVVDEAVAVVVEPVADLRRTGVDGRIAVVAVRLNIEAVPVGIPWARGVLLVGAGE